MSKNIKKIEKLSTQLNSINQKIEYFISVLDKIKTKYNIFTIQTIKDKPISNDLNLYCYCECALSFNIDNQTHHFSFFGAQLSYLNISHINKDLKFVLDFIEENIGLSNIQEILSTSIALYHNIKVLYEEINFNNSDFTKNSAIIISYFKKIVKEQTFQNDENYKYCYLKFRKDNSFELVDFSYKYTFDSNSIQIKFPIWNEIEQFLIENNLEQSRYNYENTFKEQFFLLNKTIFDLLYISKNSIQFYISKNKNELYKNYDFKYLFLINSMQKEDINIIAKKIELREKIINF